MTPEIVKAYGMICYASGLYEGGSVIVTIRHDFITFNHGRPCPPEQRMYKTVSYSREQRGETKLNYFFRQVPQFSWSSWPAELMKKAWYLTDWGEASVTWDSKAGLPELHLL